MHKVLTAKQMREVDGYMINDMEIPGILLMENAAMAVCRIITEEHKPCKIHVYCGTGNNGGDGLAVARILLAQGYDVYTIIAGKSESMTADTAINFALFKKLGKKTARCIKDISELYEWGLPKPEVVVDALFGTGLSREVDGLCRDLIKHINSSHACVVSVDIPSGVEADTGCVLGDAVAADHTVSFQYYKAGHFLFPGRYCCGKLHLAKIGVDEACKTSAESRIYAYTSGRGVFFNPRDIDANKGSYGRLLVIAGSNGMAGAAVLTCKAASRSGAGLVTLASVEEVVSVVQNNLPEATCKQLCAEEGQIDRRSIFDIARAIKGKTALAVGPGLGVGEHIKEVVEHVIKNYSITKILDADALNAIAERPAVLLERAGELILTPHPKEFSRLIDSDTEYVLENCLSLAKDFVKKYGVVLVLKGATTIVAAPDGRVALVAAGSPGMAKGGSGDVLTGIIGSFVAQGMGAYESALKGVYVAAMAGEYAALQEGEYSASPMDTIKNIGKAINSAIKPHSHEAHFAPRAKTEKTEKDNTEQEDFSATITGAPPVLSEKTAEQALAEIAEKERENTREIDKEKIEKNIDKIKRNNIDLLNSEEFEDTAVSGKPDEHTRRRIG